MSSGTNASGRRKKAPAGDFATRVVTQSGDVADLKDSPLEYGADVGLTDEARKEVDAFSKKRQTAKVEYGVLLTDDGTQLINKRGGSGSVALPTYLYNQADVMMHNHPRANEPGYLGGTFSAGRTSDINTFASTNVHTMFATAAEGNYYIHKEQGFDGAGLGRYAWAELTKAKQAHNARVAALAQQTPMDYNDYIQKRRDSWNRMLVDLHNAYLAGQKKYGYTYGLERRK